MRVTSLAFAAASLLSVIAAPALAADTAPAHPVREACAADYAKFCAGQDPRSDTGRACIRQHRTEFTPACQGAMAARRQDMMERIKTACAAELAKFCTGSSQTDERPGRCLRDHKDEFSETCKAALPDRRS